MVQLRGLYGLPGLRRPRDWLDMKQQALNACNKLVEKILSDRGSDVLYEFDEISDTLCNVLDAAELARNVSPDPAHVEASESVLRELSQYMQELNSNGNLYEALLRKQNASTLEEHELLRSLQRDFAVRGGPSGSPETRRQIVSIQNEIIDWSIRVSTVLKRTEMVAENRKQRANFSQEAWNVLISLLNRRHDLAQALSYPSYAHLAAADKLLRHPGEVSSFLDSVSALLAETRDGSLRRAKVPVRAYQNALFGKIQPYLGVDQVLKVFNALLGELFGIRLFPLQSWASRDMIWHPSVTYTVVIDERDGNQIGEVFFDLFAREGKIPGAAHYALRGSRRRKDGSLQRPCAAIVCDFPESIRGSGMHHYQLETLLHEFGHVLHTVLSRTSFQHLSGTRGPLDFVEIPSHLLENFAWDPGWVRRFAPEAPLSLVQDLEEAKKEAVMAELHLQAPFAALDLALHSFGHFGWGSEAQSRIRRLIRQTAHGDGPREHAVNRESFPYLPHIVGYGGCYYSYILARVLAAEIWGCLFRNPTLSLSRAGEILRWQCLCFGAAREPRQILSDLLGGSAPSFKGIAEEMGLVENSFSDQPVLPAPDRMNHQAEPLA